MRHRIQFRRIDVMAAIALLDHNNVLRFDVRDAASFAQGHMAEARHLTQRNLSDVIGNTARQTPVLIYCYHGNASQEYAQTFSDFGFAEVYSLDGGYEAWQWMSASRSVGLISAQLREWLLSHGFPDNDINAVIANRTTPLMKAAHAGDTAGMRELLAAGADVGARNADGNNALWLACVGRHLDVIDLLVSAGIDIDNRNDNGATALMYAASSGRADVVAHLLAKGAATAPETLDGFTALDMAASLECLDLLRRASRAAAAEVAP